MSRELDVIGLQGFVGSGVAHRLSDSINLAPTKSELDITKKDDIHDFLHCSGAKFVLLLSAYTNVDRAQTDKSDVYAVNVSGTRMVSDLCRETSKHLIFISTDFVFSGTRTNPGPYSTSDKTETQNSLSIGEYARTKMLAELAVAESGCRHSIIRISYPFGNPDNEKDFALKTLRLVQKGYPLFSDQRFSPTYIPDLAKAIERILTENLTGIYHVACTPITTPFEFGKYLVEKLGLDLEVKPGSLESFMIGKTPKPLCGGLIPSNEFQVHTWKAAIDEISAEVEKVI